MPPLIGQLHAPTHKAARSETRWIRRLRLKRNSDLPARAAVQSKVETVPRIRTTRPTFMSTHSHDQLDVCIEVWYSARSELQQRTVSSDLLFLRILQDYAA